MLVLECKCKLIILLGSVYQLRNAKIGFIFTTSPLPFVTLFVWKISMFRMSRNA